MRSLCPWMHRAVHVLFYIHFHTCFIPFSTVSLAPCSHSPLCSVFTAHIALCCEPAFVLWLWAPWGLEPCLTYLGISSTQHSAWNTVVAPKNVGWMSGWMNEHYPTQRLGYSSCKIIMDQIESITRSHFFSSYLSERWRCFLLTQAVTSTPALGSIPSCLPRCLTPSITSSLKNV